MTSLTALLAHAVWMAAAFSPLSSIHYYRSTSTRIVAPSLSLQAALGNAGNTTAVQPYEQQQQQQQQQQPVPMSSEKKKWFVDQVRSVNYFISRKCNYQCKFCFHTQKTTHTLSIEEATRGLELLREAGTEKINFAGGEPFVRPHLLGRLCQKAHELGMAVSIISNGSLITEEWMKQYGYYVDVLGVSVDSFDPSTNAKIGRGGDSNNQHVQRMLRVRQWCRDFHIKFKVNTVVCKHNMEEDMTQKMLQLDPVRWKIFQVLVLKGENAGAEHGDLRDATALTVTGDEYRAFVDRHRPHFSERVLVPESNEVMQNSYLLLDEDLCFLDCSDGGKVPGASILDVGVEAALLQAGFDFEMFHERGGIYDWSRDRSRDEPDGRLRP